MIVEQLIAPVSGLLDKFIPDADQKAKLAHEIATLSEKQHQEIMLQQIELAKIEAQGSMLQRTWRPMIGHCCWVGLAYNVIISPFMVTSTGDTERLALSRFARYARYVWN